MKHDETEILEDLWPIATLTKKQIQATVYGAPFSCRSIFLTDAEKIHDFNYIAFQG